MMSTKHLETLSCSFEGFDDDDDVGQEGLVREQWRHHLIPHDLVPSRHSHYGTLCG